MLSCHFVASFSGSGQPEILGSGEERGSSALTQRPGKKQQRRDSTEFRAPAVRERAPGPGGVACAAGRDVASEE